MITKSDVVTAYQLILGREPESEKAINNHIKMRDMKELRAALICSNEFNEKYRRIKGISTETMIQSDDIDEPKLIFLHIPKTGGTTLHEILISHYKSQQICPERFNKLTDHKAGALAKYRFFSGHYDYYSTHVIPGKNNKIFTLFREPESRLISFYYFLKSHRLEFAQENELVLPILANKYSFEDFLQCPEVKYTNNIYNPYIQLLTCKKPTGEYSIENDNIILNKRDKELLEEAKSIMSDLFAFGILERYDESASLILKKLGLPTEKKINKKMVLSELVKTNSHKKVTKTPLSSEAQKLIRDNTYLDHHLYNHAVKIFNASLQE